MARGKKAKAAASLLASKRLVQRIGHQAKASLAASAAGLTARGAGRPAGRGGKAGGSRSGAADRGARDKAAPAEPRAPMSEAARHRLREMGALALLGFTLFLLLACGSAYGDSNLCGPTGEWFGTFLLGSFGYAAYLLVLCLGLWGGTLFARLQPESFSIRFMGLVLCLVALSGLLAHFLGGLSGHFPSGGTVGEYINHQLRDVAGLGLAGTRIALIVLTLMTFVLATDIVYYTHVMRTLGWLRARRATVSSTPVMDDVPEVGEARPLGSSADLSPFKVLEGLPGASIPDTAGAAGAARRARSGAPAAAVATPTAPTAPGKSGTATRDGAGKDAPAREAAARESAARDAAAKEAAAREAGRSERSSDGARAGDKAGAGTKGETAGKSDAGPAASAPKIHSMQSGAGPRGEAAPAASTAPATPAGRPGKPAGVAMPDPGDAVAAEAGDVAAGPGTAGPAASGAGATARPMPRVRRPADEQPVQKTLYGETAVNPAAAAAIAGPYKFPGDELLDEQESVDQVELDALLANKTATLERTLESFKVEARVVEIQKGPVISMFEMELAPGIKVEKVRSLEDDLAIALRARSVRIVAPIPGKNTIGIEVPNPLRETVRMKPLLHSREYMEGKYALPIFLGRDASGRPMVVDLARMPHLLVAGATGSGKSVCLNSILVSFLYTRSPEQLKLILIDPKMVELTQFANAPHLACPVISDMKRAPGILEWAIMKMEERYKLLSQAGVRNIYSYNKLGVEGLRAHFGERADDPDFPRFLPFIVIVIDELADLMMTSAKEVETSITRLAAKSRAVGIHLIVATQRPSTNVITGLIKANLPTRIAFMVSSKIDSRVILDENGAEQLLGEGDLLMMSPASSALVRGQGTYLSEEEVQRIMNEVKTVSGHAYEPDLVQRRSENARDPDSEDELYDAAVRFVFSTERGSASLLQRKFAIGYTRASRLIDMMAEEGVLGEYKGSQARELTMTLQDWIALKPDARGSDDDDSGRGPRASGSVAHEVAPSEDDGTLDADDDAEA